MIMLIIIVLLTGVFYAVDLFAQGICRSGHNDQAFLIPFITDELLELTSNDIMIAGLDVKTTINTIIDDCRNEIHFSEHFFRQHLIRLQNDVDQAMGQLNQKIDDKFIAAIKTIDIRSDLDRLDQFSMIVNTSTDETRNKVQQIHTNFQAIERQFEKIDGSIPTLPTSVVNQTIENMRTYMKTVLESTIDTCPLPLAIIYKTDTFLCHKFATSINGLWFSLFLYMFSVIFGLCICGLCFYK